MTKKVLALTLGILLVSTASFAKQVDSGTIEIAGQSNGGFTLTKADGSSVNELGLSVSGLYYIIPNLGVGAGVSFSKLGGDADGSSWSLTPEAVYQFPLAEDLNAYADVHCGYASVDSGGDSDDTVKGWYAGVAAGVSYFMNDASSVNVGLFYAHDGGDFDDNRFGLGFGLSIYLK